MSSSKAELLRCRLRERVTRKKKEAREEHKKKLVEFQVLTAQAESLIADIDKVSAKILLDKDEEAKHLALEKLAGQRVSLEKHIAEWRELENHLRLMNDSLKGR
jgi:hypothetical protein